MIVEFCVLSLLICLQTNAAGFLTVADVQERNVTVRQAANIQQVISETLDLQAKFAQQEQQISELERERHELLTSMFDQSGVYNGHHYLASRTNYEHIDSVEVFCELFDGYLVEINDQGEHNFLRSFLDTTEIWAFLVGAVKNYANQWEYRYSGQPVSYFDWETNPMYDGSCMLVSRRNNWQMSPYLCVVSSVSDGFICEIPSPP